jgi:hypothetical protein
VHRAYKFRLWTNANHERELDIALETHRRLYNTCLDYRQLAYSLYGASISYFDCCRWFTHRRKADPYLSRITYTSAQSTMRRLDKAFRAFFRRVKAGQTPGHPRFKGRERFDSISFPAYGDGVRLIGAKLRIKHVGTIRIKLHRPVNGMPSFRAISASPQSSRASTRRSESMWGLNPSSLRPMATMSRTPLTSRRHCPSCVASNARYPARGGAARIGGRSVIGLPAFTPVSGISEGSTITRRP